MTYRLVRELADDSDTDVDVDVAVARRVLEVSGSGYHAWLDRPPSTREEADTVLLKHIKEVHEDPRETYRRPRIHTESVLGRGLVLNHKRVARLRREAGIQGLYRRRHRRGPTGPATGDDLVKRNSTARATDRPWLTDITGHPTKGRETVPRGGHGHLFATYHRMVDHAPYAHRTRHRHARNGHAPTVS